MRRFIVTTMILLVIFAVLGVGAVVGVYMWAAKDLPPFKQIADYKPSLVTTVYTRKGDVLGYFYREKRFLVRLNDMPDFLPMAFLAAEDSTFYEHEGIDLRAILRAFIKNIKAGEHVQGGSTITQQIIKRLLLTAERSYERKIKEAILAYRLENYLSKDEILTIYLNQIYLGARSYGVEAAARTYFGKHVDGLTLAECALIAGLPPAPSRYNPYRHKEQALARQKYVLKRMLDLEWITEEQHKAALAEPLEFKQMEDISWKQGAYYLEEVRRWLIDYLRPENMEKLGMELDRYGEDAVYESGLHVYTAIDMEHQRAAEEAMKWGLEASTKRRGWQGPIMNLPADKFDMFLQKETIAAESLEPGQWVKALVTEVTSRGAKVKVGALDGYISVKTMAWCRKPNIKRAPEQVAKIRDARKVLKVGDVVWASVVAPEEEKKDEAAKTAPKPETPTDDIDVAPIIQLALEQKPRVQGALVSLEPPTGEVRALVGGYSFDSSQFNRATQAHRQPGSAFKPIVYSAALDQGFSPASVVVDGPIVIKIGKKVWKPANYSDKFYGPTMLRTALAKSRNLVTIRIAQRIGISKIIKRAKALGLEPDFPPYLPICLGAVAVTPINLTHAYTAFARGGSTIKPRMVLHVKQAWGDTLFDSEPDIKQVITAQNAYIMDYMLKQVVETGTAVRARKLKRPLAGKTGTTNDEQDAWFMGFTPYLLTGVYVGFDQVQPMGKRETGSRAALPIWLRYRMAVEKNYPEEDFPAPPGIVYASISSHDKKEDGSLDQRTWNMPFMQGVDTRPVTETNLDKAPILGQDGETVEIDVSSMGGADEDNDTRGEELMKQLF